MEVEARLLGAPPRARVVDHIKRAATEEKRRRFPSPSP